MTEPKRLPFRHPAVRDLAWVMSSPGLMKAPMGDDRLVTDEWCQHVYVEHAGQLHDLDKDPRPLLDYLSSLKSHRLGFYFEALLAFWFEYILRPDTFEKNVPVFRKLGKAGQRTLGEFDFLFGQNHQQRLQHWEVTVKFYLYHENVAGNVTGDVTGDVTEKIQWVGPAGQDRFDIKLTRIFEYQLRLSETTEGNAVLAGFGFPTVRPAAFIKGYLFYPVDRKECVLAEKSSVNPYSSFELSSTHLRGWWARHGETARPKRFSDSHWLVLPKRRWLSTAWCESASSELLDDEGMTSFCERYFDDGKPSILIAEMQLGFDGWNEVSRGFVVAPCWP